MKKSELLLNPYKEHLKKPYLHWAWTLEIDWVQYSADEYITMLEEENRKLKEEVRFLEECLDRKEKLNEKYRKELENYVYDAKQVRDIC